MSDQEKRGPYVYQPFGVQHPDHWKTGRIYGIGGLPLEATCRGFTKPEAEAICAALKPVTSASIEEAISAFATRWRGWQDGHNFDADLRVLITAVRQESTS